MTTPRSVRITAGKTFDPCVVCGTIPSLEPVKQLDIGMYGEPVEFTTFERYCLTCQRVLSRKDQV